METAAPHWRKCTTCKKLIGFNQKYWVCSVSTCNRQRTGLVFCNLSCFDAHVPVLNHRDAGAFEKRSPSEAEWKREQEGQSAKPTAPAPKPAATPGPSTANAPSRGPTEAEILVVVSKVKEYIRKRSGMNTSDAVMRRLTTWVIRWSEEAMKNAKQAGRETVLDRDVR
jgi:hypothetical protein